MLSIIGNVLDQLVARNVFHLTNTIFEGCIGLAHLFLPGKIYEKTFIESHSEQILLGRYYGVMMISLAMISFGARMDRRVAKGLSLYHCTASAMNLVWGCGIDGLNNNRRDMFCSCVHGFIGLGFSWMVFPKKKNSAQAMGLKAPWILHNASLELLIVGKNWQSIMDAVQEISEIAEKMNHHPDLFIEDYRKLKILIRTHCNSEKDPQGFVTQKDIQLARAIEAIPFKVSEKWKKENNITWVGIAAKSS